jgi:hypothetical protein
MYLYLKCSGKWGIWNIKLKVINQHKNDMCHVQSFEKDFYLGALGSFHHDFTPIKLKFCNSKVIIIIAIINGNLEGDTYCKVGGLHALNDHF